MSDLTKTTIQSNDGSQPQGLGPAVAIIGGGPIGLVTAAQMAQRGEPFVLFESGVGVASNVRSWAHVQLFSPWRYNIDQAAHELLKASGWQMRTWKPCQRGKN